MQGKSGEILPELVKQIFSSSGLLPLPERTALHPQIFGRLERKTYSVEKVLLETLPGYYLGGNLYRPLKAAAGVIHTVMG